MKDHDKIIMARRSVRSFDKQEQMTETDVETLRKAISDATSPFGGKVSIALKHFDLEGTFKPSTYGTINGASWLCGKIYLETTDAGRGVYESLGFTDLPDMMKYYGSENSN